MELLSSVQRIKEIYENNENIIEYINKVCGMHENSPEAIMLAYDFQAGSYVETYRNSPEFRKDMLHRLARHILSNDIHGAVLEAGVGEATTMISLLAGLPKDHFNTKFGFDISWSRIKVAKQFCCEEGHSDIMLCTGDMNAIPFLDNSFDLVYTHGAIEPNGGNEKAILQELYRVSSKYLILIEPAYEFANKEQREYMLMRGYVTNLHKRALELGYNVVEYELYGKVYNPLNPYGFMVIQKETPPPPDTTTQRAHSGSSSTQSGVKQFACPVTKTPLEFFDNAYYSAESMLAYPIIQGIPCLLPNNAIVATKFL